METKEAKSSKKKVLNFPRADFFVLYPFFIDDWAPFEEALNAAGIWVAKEDCNRQALKNLANCYLGEDEAQDFPIRTGLAYTGNIQGCKDPALSSFTQEVAFRDAKGNLLFSSGDSVRTFWPEFEIELHITPSRHGGVALFQLSTGECPLDMAVRINYVLQKYDPALIPTMCSRQGGEWVSVGGRSTLKELFDNILPKGIRPMNEARFLMATDVGVDTSGSPRTEEIENALVMLGLVKDVSYKFNGSEREGIRKLFENIWTFCSHEGFATVHLTPDMEKEKFLKDFFGKFPKSYLPLYLVSVLAELTYMGALRNPDYVANNPEESDRVRETNLVLNFEPSHYTHLNRLMASFREVWHFDKKFEIILSNIEARIAKIEAQRLQIEKENQALAQQRRAEIEQERKKREEERILEEKKRDARDRNINLLLGFIGLGQVVFAILQLVGAENIFGLNVAWSQALRITSIAFSAVFALLIVILLVIVLQRKK